MQKKLLPIFVIILISLGWFIYRAFNVPVEKVVDYDSDAKVVTVDTENPPSLKLNDTSLNSEPVSKVQNNDQVTDDKFVAFDKLEKIWTDKVHEIIGDQKYPIYLEMKRRNDLEKMQAYKEYHEYLRQKYGDKFTYNITDDQSISEKKINQRYLKDLLKLIGPENFKSYISAKDQINEEIRRHNKEAIQIEF